MTIVKEPRRAFTQIISRQQALDEGLARYFTGKPCKYGHVSERWVTRTKYTGLCCACVALATSLDPQFAETRKHAQEAECVRLERKRKKSAERTLASRRWRAKQDPDVLAAIRGKGNANQRYPGCICASFDLMATVPFYTEARNRSKEYGIGYEVDHIVPLSRGGKHCASNLRVITALENVRKYDSIAP